MRSGILKSIACKILSILNAPALSGLNNIQHQLDGIQYEIERNRVLLAKQLIYGIIRKGVVSDLRRVEFQVFSQWGEDGIIQYLISNIEIPNEVFIEFGVENYKESNTRFLLVNDNWKGVIYDADDDNIKFIHEMPLYWRHNLQAECAFITAENINSLIKDSGITGDIGVLSIDIDGNDYWIWKAIDKETISPRIVIVEYNSVFGGERSVVVPYHPNFQRSTAHYSNLYFGASLAAFCGLAEEKGYKFVGSNSAGSNAFFVRADVVGTLPVWDSVEGYVESRFREGRNELGKLMFWSEKKRIEVIANFNLIDLDVGKSVAIKEIIRN